VCGRGSSYCGRDSTGRGRSCGEATVRGEAEERELWSEIIEGGSSDGALDVSENAGDVKGASTGRFREESVYMGVRCRE
jgi:hypothetical protein